MRCTPSRV